MSDSSNYSNMSDLDDIEDIDLVMQLINEDQQVAGAHNDLTVLNHSPLFDDLLDDIALVVSYEVNRVTFEKMYYLADKYTHSRQFLSNHLRLHETREMLYLNVVKKVLEKTLKGLLVSSKFALSEVGETYICPRANLAWTWIERCEMQQKKAKELRDKNTYAKLQRNLIEYVWQQHLLNN
ncbi:ALP1-like protein isoform X1 [Tanacetum coccineum]